MPDSFIKKLLPHSLLGRSLMIIVTSLVLLQVVATVIFYESHWDKVSTQLARGVAGDIGTVVRFLGQHSNAQDQRWIFDTAASRMGLVASFERGKILPNAAPAGGNLMERTLIKALDERVRKPFQIDVESMKRDVIVDVQLADGVLRVITPRKRLFSSTTYVFVIWMVGTSLFLFAVAVIFMRNQVKPIRRLAEAADNFGKGRDTPGFKPEGANEVRQAATAFMVMRERLQRQVSQRMDMLAGVSHDLRTPLTRMKLQLAMLEEADGGDELREDVAEMERMLDGYLSFARGEGDEAARPTNLCKLMNEVVEQARRQGSAIDLHTEGEITAAVRPNGFKRCVTNLVDNAARYAKHVSVRVERRGDAIEVTIDDDGPGIPEDLREEVFRPFYRLESSRNPGTGGVGLGLSIARDIIRGHGGDIELGDSPNGGLRARLILPL